MKSFLTSLLSILITTGFAQSASQYFEKIRNNEAALTAFFSQMPKGGDLHHHYSGSIYAERLLKRVITENFYVNTETMKVTKDKPSTGTWEQFSTLESLGLLDFYKQKIMQRWSVKDYNDADYPSDKLFFESFDKFKYAVDGNYDSGLVELKNRAIKENVSYLETQLSSIKCRVTIDKLIGFNKDLTNAAKSKNEKSVRLLLDVLYDSLMKKGVADSAKKFNINFVERLHVSLHMDDPRFTMRYQNYVLRFMEPVELFKNIMLAFISADNSPLIAGVNIVSPEDGETSMKDYWLHMMMFRYCHSRYPAVKYSLHAGELTLGLVQPEDLTWHIRSAVYDAAANRIGHGVDIAYEDSCYSLLRYMSKNKIPVEINLVSNEFILKVKGSRHPITLYKEFGVPIIISSDDAGILRTNLAEQFVLLASRYKDFTYADIKQIVYNSINYSFIKDADVKKQILKNLDNRFKAFEASLPLK